MKWTILIALISLPLLAQEKPAATQPVLISKVRPKYTEEARRRKIEGTVVLSLVVLADGHTSNVKVMKSVDAELDESAIAAVKEYLFRPATRNGQPVDVYATVEVPFRLRDP